MDRTTLNNILKIDDMDLNLQTLLITGRMSEKFPYCALLHLYKAKISAKINHLNREEALHDAAAACPSRRMLKAAFERIVEVEALDKIKAANDELEEYFSERKENKKPTKEALIDRFLREEIAIKPKTNNEAEERFNIEKNVKSSVSEDFKFVTETMAKIYLKQGNKDKAMRIYKQLIAENPAKKIYFENQIKRIEDK
ncbi:MAG: hypothetical protein LBR17_03245 [Bacteroidales bacterium]|jgi:predicted Zn-dependent protease|nr:hypothetical protein [Bacteroidales bacterium]